MATGTGAKRASFIPESPCSEKLKYWQLGGKLRSIPDLPPPDFSCQVPLYLKTESLS